MSLDTKIALINLGVDILGFIAAIVTFVISSKGDKKATEDQTRRECVRATLTEFASIRRVHQNFANELAVYDRNEILKAYLSDLERFAVGCNAQAYAVDIVNEMSGGMLVGQYKRYFKDFIEERRRATNFGTNVKPWNKYSNYEDMMREIYKLRGLEWEEPRLRQEEMAVLDKFLNLDISTSEEVFAAFRTIEGAIEDHGEGKQGYLYIPGTRSDRCVIAAHADTVFDTAYKDKVYRSKVGYKEGVFYSESAECSIGADDRSGCAMLWLLRNSGHSLLILDGEEHGQIGANYLKDSNPELFEEINDHSFILQLDRRNSSDYRYYGLPVTPEFVSYIESETGFTLAEGKGRTDIGILCTKACGVNLSVGYYDEHKPTERLVYSEWLNTYNIVKTMLAKPLKKYKLKNV